MDIQALKLKLVKQILETESKELLENVFSTLQKQNIDFWEELSDDVKEEIKLSKQQAEKGNTQNWEDVYKRLSNKAS